MGVHNTDAYPEIKRLLGIPEDEPIFILRAQDKFAIHAVVEYAEITFDDTSDEFSTGMDSVENEFRQWQKTHPGKMKVPD